jgi:hypothetical protein
MGQDGVSDAERHKGLAHPDLVGKDLDFEALSGLWVKEAFEQDVHSTLLAGSVI